MINETEPNNPGPPEFRPPPSSPCADPLAPSSDLADHSTIPNVAAAIEAILRQPGRVLYQLRQPRSARLSAAMLAAGVACSLVYGAVVGTFAMGAQLWMAPIKVAGGLCASVLICLPSLYIFACLSGSQARLVEIVGLVAGLLLLTALLLIGFAPVAWLFSQSTQSAVWMGTLHLIFWFIAAGFGLRFLAVGFAHSRAQFSIGLQAWVVIFVLVALQMTTALRPIVGPGETFLPAEKKFFLRYWSECLQLTDERPGASAR